MRRLREPLNSGQLVAFTGAGVSIPPPSCLPSWLSINRGLITHMIETTRAAVPEADFEQPIQDLLKQELPPEFVSQAIVERLRDKYFEVLQALDADEFNRNHELLAHLLKHRRLAAVITTNFDTLLEQACSEARVSNLRIVVTPDDFSEFLNGDRQFEHPVIFKLHGTATAPETFIDTLNQRAKGLPPATAETLTHVMANHPVLFLGYSGADLAVNDNYLRMRAVAADAPGFFWSHPPTSPPDPAVLNLSAHYGERAVFYEGWLPDWLDAVIANTGAIAVDKLPPMRGFTKEKIEAIRQRRADAVDAHVARWCQEQEYGWCGLILADLLMHGGLWDTIEEPLRAIAARLENDEGERKKNALGVAREILGIYLTNKGDTAGAIEQFEGAASVWNDLDVVEPMVHVATNGAIALFQRGDNEGAKLWFNRALDLARQLDMRDAESTALGNLGMIAEAQGDYETAIGLQEQAVAIKTELGEEHDRIKGLVNLAIAQMQLKRLDEAERNLDTAVAATRRLGDMMGENVALTNLVNLHQMRGDLERAHTMIHTCIEQAERLGDEPKLATALLNLGQMQLYGLNQRDAAEQTLRRAVEIERRLGTGATRGQALVRLGEWHWLREEWDDAEALFREALPVAERLGAKAIHAQALRSLAMMCDRQEKLQEAEKLYQQAYEVAEPLDDPQILGPIAINLASMYGRLGHLEEAKQITEVAIGHFERFDFPQLDDVRAYLKQVEDTLAESAAEAAASPPPDGAE